MNKVANNLNVACDLFQFGTIQNPCFRGRSRYQDQEIACNNLDITKSDELHVFRSIAEMEGMLKCIHAINNRSALGSNS